MNKLRLDLDDLRVDSFATSSDAAAERGTVHGQAAHEMLASAKPTCISCTFATDPCICDPIHPLTERC